MIGALLGAIGGGIGSGIANGSSSFLSPLIGTGIQLLPGIMGSTGMKNPIDSRSILNIQNLRDEINAERQSSMIMNEARRAIGTARSVLASSGFSSSVGSMAESIQSQTYENMGADLEMIKLSRDVSQITRGMKYDLADIKESRRISPFQSELFKKVTTPVASRGFNNLQKMLESFK